MNIKKYSRNSKKHPIKEYYSLNDEAKNDMGIAGGLTIKGVWIKDK